MKLPCVAVCGRPQESPLIGSLRDIDYLMKVCGDNDRCLSTHSTTYLKQWSTSSSKAYVDVGSRIAKEKVHVSLNEDTTLNAEDWIYTRHFITLRSSYVTRARYAAYALARGSSEERGLLQVSPEINRSAHRNFQVDIYRTRNMVKSPRRAPGRQAELQNSIGSVGNSHRTQGEQWQPGAEKAQPADFRGAQFCMSLMHVCEDART